MKKLKIISLAVLALSLNSCRKDFNYVEPVAPPVTTTVYFGADIYPLLITATANCNGGCHSGGGASGLNFQNQALAYSTLTASPPSMVIPGNHSSSMFYTSITTGGTSGIMPQGSSSSVFSSAELETIKAWINQGALNN